MLHPDILIPVSLRSSGPPERFEGISPDFRLVAALFALAAVDVNRFFVYVAYLPAVMFWVLDAYFLR